MSKIAVIGGGAAGMMAAIRALEKGHQVTLFEKNEKLGKKLYITGKGRCNVTNACETDVFFTHMNGNAKFLYSSFYAFDNQAVQEYIQKAGCPLKVERGNRVFPVSDHSSDVIKALRQRLEKLGCEILYKSEIKELLAEDMPCETDEFLSEDNSKDNGKNKKSKKKKGYEKFVTGVKTGDGKKYFFDSVIVATGGVSYPVTGSTGDGYKFGRKLGLDIVEPVPSLVPFETKETWAHSLQGLALKNVTATLFADGKKVFSQMGELLFTHFGISGPLILTASSELARKKARDVKVILDLKPAIDAAQFDKRLIREFEENHKKQVKNIMPGIYPARLGEVILELAGIDGERSAYTVTKPEREALVRLTKELPLTITGTRGFDEAIITCGGIALKEVNPSTMECKTVKGLYFAGEVLDLDAHTGGYNLQIAWSTGYLAGDSV